MRLQNAHTTEIRAQTSREYKKEVNKQFRKYHSDLVKKIRVLKGSDPKTYWKIINGTILKNKTRQNAFLPRYF